MSGGQSKKAARRPQPRQKDQAWWATLECKGGGLVVLLGLMVNIVCGPGQSFASASEYGHPDSNILKNTSGHFYAAA
jgi:hypothetical protein